MKTKLYYVMDPMCGWCYGFSDVMSQIHDKYKADFDFTVLPAGMWVGDHVQVMNSQLGSMIKSHNTTITKVTGKSFGPDFEANILEKDQAVLDSLPGSKAIIAMQNLQEDKVFAYIKQIYQAFYIEGRDMNDWRIYAELAAKYGIPEAVFQAEFFSEENLPKVKQAFDLAEKLGATTYPSLVAVQENEIQLVSQGYTAFSELDARIARLS
ncbi:MAG: DsbA family protein [Sporomusaceae bacterium]|nr:DsbA family protein [Sporomusaceae bacterium]